MEFVCSFFRGNVSSFFRGNVSLKNSFRLCQTFTNCQDKLVTFGLSFQMVNERPINHKLCIVLIFFSIFLQVKSCQEAKDCSKSYECCGGTCCEAKYYTEFAKLPCISHLGCQVRVKKNLD